MSQITAPKMKELLAEFVDGEKLHGYEVIQRTGFASGYTYPALWRLEELGLLRSREESRPRNGRLPRRFYTITAAGKRELH